MIKLTPETFAKRFPQIGSGLERGELEALLPLLKIQYVEASEALLVEGTVTDSLYFVWEGELDVVMQSPEGEYKVATIERGSLLGEISLLSPGPTTATVRSELGCIALHLDIQSLETFWEKHPHAASVFIRIISSTVAKRTRAADSTLQTLKQDRTQDRANLLNAQSTLLAGKDG